ncbi:hypothetical protein AOLI_G00329400, partial [Acnodon oligacanthus]
GSTREGRAHGPEELRGVKGRRGGGDAAPPARRSLGKSGIRLRGEPFGARSPRVRARSSASRQRRTDRPTKGAHCETPTVPF